jgi:alanine racemase
MTASEHGAVLTIDLGALADNWRLLARLAQAKNPSAQTGAVVKADAYGLGIEAAVPALAKAGCKTFFVAHLSEARRARAIAPEAIIYVLNGLPRGASKAMLDAGLQPVIGSVEEAKEWAAHSFGNPCALHVDTGMNRLGLDAEGLDPGAFKNLQIDLLMTHFAASEVPDDPANAMQIAAFAEVARLFPDTPKSLLNSSGHFLPDAPTYDVTRPGYALYGGNPTPGKPNPMKPVIGLEARIIQLREVEDGTKVGYNGTWTAKGRRKLATISLGYADGYPRNASARDRASGGSALVGGVLCPFAGSVSMDLIIVDVTDVPAMALSRGAPVTLIGGALDIDTVGAGARTIGYEMLTNLGKRYQRHYIGGKNADS